MVIRDNIIQFIEQNYDHIGEDQNTRNSTSKKKHSLNDASQDQQKQEKA